MKTLPKYMRVALAACSLCGGCAQLLPNVEGDVASQWSSFDQARQAIERIEPGRTTAADLRTQGIHPFASTNVQLLSYSDVLLRFPIAASIDELDPGLRGCLRAGKACSGYMVNASNTRKDRVGGFWEDVLGFKRVVETTGWNFNALILLVDDRVVYTLYGGQPNVREHEVRRQPLGPVQGLVESVPIGGLVK